MALTFYYGSGSPFAWRVHLALKHKGAPYKLKLISFSSGDLKKPELTQLNPRQRIPIIVDEGFALYESAANTEYLDERFPDAPQVYAAIGHVWLTDALRGGDPVALRKAIQALSRVANRTDATSETLAELGRAYLLAGDRRANSRLARHPRLVGRYPPRLARVHKTTAHCRGR